MEQAKLPIEEGNKMHPAQSAEPSLALKMEDVSSLDKVLRGYYLDQINKLEKRKDRKLARQLLENHLVLPKSRQRTSKDTAYIKEILDIDNDLLEQLEDSRLIRRIHKSGNNPIYEISHDTLVEPILAEKNNREAISQFIKKTWKYVAFLFLLWFLFGMLFENTFEVIPSLNQEKELVQTNKSIDILMKEQVLHIREDLSSFLLPLPPIVLDQALQASDSILIKLPIDPINLLSLASKEGADQDTISIKLTTPIEIPGIEQDSTLGYRNFTDVIVPLAPTYDHSGDAKNELFVKLSGLLKMTEKGGTAIPEEFNKRSEPIDMKLGHTIIQAQKNLKTVPVNFTLQLSDLFKDEYEKNTVKNIFGDRPVNLSYEVRVRPTPYAPKIEYPTVQGIEVQYADGHSRFIPGEISSTQNEKIHIVVKGESLYAIAKQYKLVDEKGNISTQALMQLNGLQSHAIVVGQELRIPVREEE